MDGAKERPALLPPPPQLSQQESRVHSTPSTRPQKAINALTVGNVTERGLVVNGDGAKVFPALPENQSPPSKDLNTNSTKVQKATDATTILNVMVPEPAAITVGAKVALVLKMGPN